MGLKSGVARHRGLRMKMDPTVHAILFTPLTWPMILVHKKNLLTFLIASLYASEEILNHSLLLSWRKLRSLEDSSTNHLPEHKTELKDLEKVDA